MSLPREYGKIQKGRRIAISDDLLKMLGWEIDDQVLKEVYRGKLIIENLSKTIKPLEERIS